MVCTSLDKLIELYLLEIFIFWPTSSLSSFWFKSFSYSHGFLESGLNEATVDFYIKQATFGLINLSFRIWFGPTFNIVAFEWLNNPIVSWLINTKMRVDWIWSIIICDTHCTKTKSKPIIAIILIVWLFLTCI